jgi:cysteine sulfinate desulfinase
MLLHASHDFFTPQPFPVGWEAGTPHIDGIHSLPIAYSSWHEAWRMNPDKEGMTRTLIAGLNALPVSLIGAPDAARIGLVSFMSPLWHAHDLGTLLAERGIFVRVGQHCAQPLFESLQCAGSVRVSFGPYNTIDDVHILLSTLKEIL